MLPRNSHIGVRPPSLAEGPSDIRGDCPCEGPIVMARFRMSVDNGASTMLPDSLTRSLDSLVIYGINTHLVMNRGRRTMGLSDYRTE